MSMSTLFTVFITFLANLYTKLVMMAVSANFIEFLQNLNSEWPKSLGNQNMLIFKVTHFSYNLSFEVATTSPNPEIWPIEVNISHWFSGLADRAPKFGNFTLFTIQISCILGTS